MLKKNIMVFRIALSIEMEDPMKTSISKLVKLEHRLTYPKRHGNRTKFQPAPKVEYISDKYKMRPFVWRRNISKTVISNKITQYLINKCLTHKILKDT